MLAGLDLGPGDEIVTSDSEHPGLIGPLLAARMRGVKIRAVPLRDVADAVGPRTTLVACSHVGWVSGERAPAALAEVDVPVILDGAQGAGAVPVDVRALGCAAYAAAGQKWLCGADGTGLLYLAPGVPRAPARGRAELPVLRGRRRGARRRPQGHGRLPRHARALARGARVLARRVPGARGGGLGRGPRRGRGRAPRASPPRWPSAAARSRRATTPRSSASRTTTRPRPRDRLAAAGIVIRNLPGRPLLRASVGAWNNDDDLDRLLSALA